MGGAALALLPGLAGLPGLPLLTRCAVQKFAHAVCTGLFVATASTTSLGHFAHVLSAFLNLLRRFAGFFFASELLERTFGITHGFCRFFAGCLLTPVQALLLFRCRLSGLPEALGDLVLTLGLRTGLFKFGLSRCLGLSDTFLKVLQLRTLAGTRFTLSNTLLQPAELLAGLCEIA